MKVNKYAPVLITALDRYEHLKRCVDSLSRNTHALKTVVYITLDAPVKEKQRKGYNRIIKYLPKISGFKKVIVIKRDKNFGSVKNAFESLDALFKQYDAVIVSEDDNYFSPNFLDYMNKGLQIFKDRDDVFAICGHNVPNELPVNYPYNFYLFKGVSFWGIGLWKKKYNSIELSVNSVKKFLASYKNILKIIKVEYYLLPHLFDVVNKNIVAADIIFSMNMVMNNMYCIYPALSKVRNFGFDGTGVNCVPLKKDIYSNQLIDEAKIFSFSTPEHSVTEDNGINGMIQEVQKIPLAEVLKRAILFLAKNTNLHNSYMRIKKAFANI